jgi:tetratricopeptide (TPR) repeat protein
MAHDRRQFVRVSKRLAEAEGYLELGMAQHALDRLDGLDDAGLLASAVDVVRGKAMWQQRRYDDAVESLRSAVARDHSPHHRQAWLALSVYYRDRGLADEAIDRLARARGARLPDRRPQSP